MINELTKLSFWICYILTRFSFALSCWFHVFRFIYAGLIFILYYVYEWNCSFIRQFFDHIRIPFFLKNNFVSHELKYFSITINIIELHMSHILFSLFNYYYWVLWNSVIYLFSYEKHKKNSPKKRCCVWFVCLFLITLRKWSVRVQYTFLRIVFSAWQ